MTNAVPTVVFCAPIAGRDLSAVRAFEPAIRLIDGNDAFDAYNRARGKPEEAEKRAALDTMLAQADVLCMSFPMPAVVAAAAPKLRWFHHTNAGVSNLWRSDVWTAEDVTLTSGRGHVRPTAMAEYCIAAALSFARSMHDGELDRANARFDRSHYAPKRIEGSTMGVVGLGGIGSEVARLAKALGMRVVATRRSVESRQEDAEGVDVLLPASELTTLMAESDFVSVTTALTAETNHLISHEALNATTRPVVITNISRGEVVDELALLDAIAAGKVRGAVLDVYEGEMEGKPPRPELWACPQVILTPHISTGGDANDDGFMRLFVENLRRYLEGDELINVVDRARGY